MLVRVGIENNNDDRTIAWALEHPGCFAYGKDARQAQDNMPQAIAEYAAWIRKHAASWAPFEMAEVRVEETFDAYFIPRLPAASDGKDTIMIESFFQFDREPLTAIDVQHALELLDWSRQDLLQAIRGLSTGQLDKTYPGERWSINGILGHVGGAEWWYQERIGAPFPLREQDLPGEPLNCLELVRQHFKSLLPELEGRTDVRDLEGETWSPRKALRRALWHERDHTQHIRKLLAGVIAPA